MVVNMVQSDLFESASDKQIGVYSGSGLTVLRTARQAQVEFSWVFFRSVMNSRNK